MVFTLQKNAIHSLTCGGTETTSIFAEKLPNSYSRVFYSSSQGMIWLACLARSLSLLRILLDSFACASQAKSRLEEQAFWKWEDQDTPACESRGGATGAKIRGNELANEPHMRRDEPKNVTRPLRMQILRSLISSVIVHTVLT